MFPAGAVSRSFLPKLEAAPSQLATNQPPTMRLLLFIVAASCSTSAGLALGSSTRLSEKWKTRGVALMSASGDHDEEGRIRTAQRLGDKWKRRKRLGAVNKKLQTCARQTGFRAKWVYCRFYMLLDAPSADERRERSRLLLEAEATRRSSLGSRRNVKVWRSGASFRRLPDRPHSWPVLRLATRQNCGAKRSFRGRMLC